MSGGVGPGSDIKLPPEPAPETTNPSPKRRFLTFRQLNALAILAVFAASGMVPLQDLAFAVFSLLYIFPLSKLAFPASPSPRPDQIFPNTRLLSLYVLFAAVIGLFLPIAYIFEGLLEGDKEGIRAAAPHVFLLSAQVFMEGVTFSGRFSLPIRVFIPVFFNAKRLSTLFEWLRAEVGKVEGEHGSRRRLLVGRSLAVVNVAFWCFNLFAFLIPVYLPRAFKRYYGKVKD